MLHLNENGEGRAFLLMCRSQCVSLIMTKKKNRPPLKRHPAWQPLSRANHQGLMFCLLLEKGLRKNVEPVRMQSFALYFYNSHWESHQRRLRAILTQLLDSCHPRRVQFQKEYDALTTLWTEIKATTSISDIAKLKDELRDFIRWQERHLFMELQETYAEEIQSWSIPEFGQNICSVWPDAFWE